MRHVCEICVLPRSSVTLSSDTTQSIGDRGSVTTFPRHQEGTPPTPPVIADDPATLAQPRLVPPLEDAQHRRESGPLSGVITELGFRPDQGMDAASSGVGLMPVFQPVVSLPDEHVVGFEALARWPMFTSMTASNVFSFANVSRQTEVLDRHCIDAAVRAALDSDLPPGSLLLINTEPAVAHTPRASHP